MEIKPINNTKVILTNEEKEKAVKLLNNAAMSFCFLRDLIIDNNLVMENIETHLSLNKFYLKDLYVLLGYDFILQKEYEEKDKKIREKNSEIRKLIESKSEEVTPESIEGALKRYETIFHAWYTNEGFDYASISNFSYDGIIAELSSRMNFKDSCRNNDSEIYLKIWSNDVGTEEKINNGWDIYKKQFGAILLDTKNNRNRLINLLDKEFPNMKIYKFIGSHNEYNDYSLKTEFFIPYADLENYFKLR